MSIDVIKKVVDSHGFNPTPRRDEIVEVYLPFDRLLGAEKIEAPLHKAMNAGVRVGILGPTGAGKTSLCEWVLGAPGSEVAAIRVPVSVESDETVTDPQAFAQHVIRTVSKSAMEPK